MIDEVSNDIETTDEIIIETPQVNPIETNTSADLNLDDESKSDSEQNVISVSTVKPNPTEPLEQNHTIDEVLTAVDKTRSDSQEVQPDRAIASDPVNSKLEPKSHPQKVNYLVVSGLALIAYLLMVFCLFQHCRTQLIATQVFALASSELTKFRAALPAFACSRWIFL